jgi:ATP-dependent Clp protease ATP-binding subunit ClpX
MDKCSFCGKSKREVTLLISGTSGFICDSCVSQANDIVKEELKTKLKKQPTIKIKKPTEIKEFLDLYVIGQDEAKKVLSVAVYNHFKRLNQMMLKLKSQTSFSSAKQEQARLCWQKQLHDY